MSGVSRHHRSDGSFYLLVLKLNWVSYAFFFSCSVYFLHCFIIPSIPKIFFYRSTHNISSLGGTVLCGVVKKQITTPSLSLTFIHTVLLLSSHPQGSLNPTSYPYILPSITFCFIFAPCSYASQIFLSMVLSLSLVIMVQITGGREAPHLSRGGIQALQAGLCQQGRQSAAANRTQREAAVSINTHRDRTAVDLHKFTCALSISPTFVLPRCYPV